MAQSEKITKLLAQLKDHLENADDWEYFPIAIDGFSVQKLPANKSKGSSLAFVYNPLGKRKGVYYHTSEEYTTYLASMGEKQAKAITLLKCIEKTNGKVVKKVVKDVEGFEL